MYDLKSACLWKMDISSHSSSLYCPSQEFKVTKSDFITRWGQNFQYKFVNGWFLLQCAVQCNSQTWGGTSGRVLWHTQKLNVIQCVVECNQNDYRGNLLRMFFVFLVFVSPNNEVLWTLDIHYTCQQIGLVMCHGFKYTAFDFSFYKLLQKLPKTNSK